MEILDRIEESGLDKLIKLLTEHCRKHYGFKDNDNIEIDTDSVNFYLYHNGKRLFNIGVEKVICKDFEFIKRLVENDKINRTDLGKREMMLSCTKYENLLMRLAISDTPIEDLISYLK